ncbi:MAG: DMT family transporter [Pseudolabrys sp.]
MQVSNLARALLWMSGALLSFSIMAISVRELAAAHLSVFEILTLRAATGLSILLILLAARPALRQHVVPRNFKLHLLRNAGHFMSQYLWATALTLLPLATVFALEFTMPAWTIVFAAWFLGERLTPSRIGVVVLGLVGVLVILRPGVAAFDPAALLVLGAALGFAITMITTKKLTATNTTFGIILWMMLIQLPIALAGSEFASFARLSTNDILPVLGLAIGGTASHYCFTNAFRAGDATVVVPIDFLRVPLIAAVGWLLYRETPDIFVFVGTIIIAGGVLWNLRAESTRKL